jgi:uncharacterized membrane protein
MNQRLWLIPRIALFSALAYVLSYSTVYLPNVNFIFFIVFMAGVMWGLVPGMLVGIFAMGLWTTFNPYGPAVLPVMLAQVSGISFSGMVGAFFRGGDWHKRTRNLLTWALIVSAILCTLLFYLPVNIVDAWMLQPFWPRFYTGMLWSITSLVVNLLVFPILFKPVSQLMTRRSPV